MADPRLTELARSDLDQAWDDLAEKSELAADQFLDDLKSDAV